VEPKLLYSWIAAEHARLHLVAAWPHSQYKEACMRAILSSIHSLSIGQNAVPFRCMACLEPRKLRAMRRSMQPHEVGEVGKAA
jgi:hypothetical protein